MNIQFLVTTALAGLLVCSQARAEGGSLTIMSPHDGATVSSRDDVILTFHVNLGPIGDHLHLYRDGDLVSMFRSLHNKVDVGLLQPGNHKVCLEVNTRDHVSTGVESCVNLTVQ